MLRPAQSWPETALAVTTDPNTGVLKALLIARRGPIKARTTAIQQNKALLVTASAELRECYRRYTTTLRPVQALARCRPSDHDDPITVAVLTARKALAQRIEFLERQDHELTAELVFGPTTSPGSNAASNVTTPSPPTTAPGSTARS